MAPVPPEFIGTLGGGDEIVLLSFCALSPEMIDPEGFTFVPVFCEVPFPSPHPTRNDVAAAMTADVNTLRFTLVSSC
jgi:hypothetical protein